MYYLLSVLRPDPIRLFSLQSCKQITKSFYKASISKACSKNLRIDLTKKSFTRIISKNKKLCKYGVYYAFGFGIFSQTSKTNAVINTNEIANDLKKISKKSNKNVIYVFFKGVIEVCISISRCLFICFIFMPPVFLYPFLFWNHYLKQCWWKIFTFSIGAAGPICVKFAQWASTRRDLFSPEMCYHLSHLQRRTNPHSWKFTKYRLEKAFGKKWREIFVKFDNDRKPVGSGCVAQVYKAYIKPENILDEELLNEIIEENQDDDSVIDFYEGAEVIGFGHLFGTDDDELDEAEHQRRELRIIREIDRITTELKQEQLTDSKELPEQDEEYEMYCKSLLEEKLSEIDSQSDDMEGLLPVAIKVLHPNIHSQFRRDLRSIKFLANLVEHIVPSLKWLSLTECVELFEKTMSQQLDLKYEARCMDEFRKNFHNINNVRFASPVWPYVTPKVLVQTYEEAEPLCQFMKDIDDENTEDVTPELKSRIAEIGLNLLLKMVFEDNLVHGDLHPGNIMIQNHEPYIGSDSSSVDNLILLDICDTLIVKPKTDKYGKMRLLILDCGITSSLTQEDMEKLTCMFKAIIKGKGEEVADLFLKHSRTQECQNVEKFRSQMSSLIKKAHKEFLNLDSIDVGELLSDVFSLLHCNKIKLESNFSSIMLAIFIIEGVGRSLNPNIDVLELAKPYILK